MDIQRASDANNNQSQAGQPAVQEAAVPKSVEAPSASVAIAAGVIKKAQFRSHKCRLVDNRLPGQLASKPLRVTVRMVSHNYLIVYVKVDSDRYAPLRAPLMATGHYRECKSKQSMLECSFNFRMFEYIMTVDGDFVFVTARGASIKLMFETGHDAREFMRDLAKLKYEVVSTTAAPVPVVAKQVPEEVSPNDDECQIEELPVTPEKVTIRTRFYELTEEKITELIGKEEFDSQTESDRLLRRPPKRGLGHFYEIPPPPRYLINLACARLFNPESGKFENNAQVKAHLEDSVCKAIIATHNARIDHMRVKLATKMPEWEYKELVEKYKTDYYVKMMYKQYVLKMEI